MEDIVIVGAGPVGLYAATLAGLHGLKGILLEGQEEVGGQLSALYPEKDIIDLPGFSRITARDFVNHLWQQFTSTQNHLEVHLQETMTKLEPIDGGYRLYTSQAVIETRSIVLTTGMGVFQPRKIGLDNEDRFENIIYSLKNKADYAGKTIAVLGGGDSAVDWALMLKKIAKDVHIVHRRNEFRAQESSVQALDTAGVHKWTPYTVAALEGESNQCQAIWIENDQKQKHRLAIDAVFVNYGLLPSPIPLPLNMKGATILVKEAYETSLNNVFAIGNIATYEGKIKNITSGLGEAVIAISRIDQRLHPNKNIPVHF